MGWILVRLQNLRNDLRILCWLVCDWLYTIGPHLISLSLCHDEILLRSLCVLQCVAVCCSVLQCIAVCCSVLQCVAMYPQTKEIGLKTITQPKFQQVFTTVSVTFKQVSMGVPKISNRFSPRQTAVPWLYGKTSYLMGFRIITILSPDTNCKSHWHSGSLTKVVQ